MTHEEKLTWLDAKIAEFPQGSKEYIAYQAMLLGYKWFRRGGRVISVERMQDVIEDQLAKGRE